ncbi:MAG: nucleotidyltransferase family protein [Caulobacteraceae bacterium]
MVLAAGLGTRMRPLTDTRPKALVEVAGKALIDHMLDRLAAAGVERAVVNVHAFADAVGAHLAARVRDRGDLEVVISDERERLLETGGALKRARPLLGNQPILVANIDSVWSEEGVTPAIEILGRAWRAEAMDALLLLAAIERSLGFDGPGDFTRDRDGRLGRRGPAPSAPFAYAGVQILDPRLIDSWPEGAYGLFDKWMEMAAEGRLHGAIMEGRWMHVGDPAARDLAEAQLMGPAR